MPINNVQVLYDEIMRRFPEINRFVQDGDDGLPYVMFAHIVRWLSSSPERNIDEPTIVRIVGFQRWCLEQPRTESADDDTFTILVIGLYEKLFEEEKLRPLIPHVLSQQDVIDAEEYYIQWVGLENYRKALEQFGPVV